MQVWTDVSEGQKLLSVGAYARYGEDLFRVRIEFCLEETQFV